LVIDTIVQGVRNYFYFFTSIIFLVLAGCGNNNHNHADFPLLNFDVDVSLLSSSILIDNSFQFYPPNGWDNIAPEQLAAAKNIVSCDSAAMFPMELLNIFKSDLGASCVISQVTSDSNLSWFLTDEFQKTLSHNFNSNNVTKGTYTLNNKKIVQYRIITQDVIAFKIFCNINNSIYQIDYFIPSKIYQSEIKKVESSIGSITLPKLGKE